MELAELVNQFDGFDAAAPREQIQLFAWFLHTHRRQDIFNNADIRACYSNLHMTDPGVSTYLPRMVGYRELVKAGSNFKLERGVRTALDMKYGTHHSVVQVSKILSDLPGKVPDLAEKTFLDEAIKCYRIEAYRACVVMTWNLAYSHLLDWILKDASRLASFNTAIKTRYPKRAPVQINSYDDFLEEFKEFEVIEICNTSGVITGNIVKILKEKLVKRNIAAHPSGIVIIQSQADDVVTDLVNNVVLLLT